MKQTILGNPEKMTQPYTQQGDCLVKKCGTKGIFVTEYEDIPVTAKKLPEGSSLVLKGQSNSHALYGGKFSLYLAESSGTIFVDVEETTVLDHVEDIRTGRKAEHHAQYIPPGKYFIDTVMEYNHIKEESKPLID